MHPTPSSKYLSDPEPDLDPNSELAALLSSPIIPTSPAPAYSALPYRDTDFHLAPLLRSRVGEVELETTDGKRFLVHRKILEQETVFFHIYYGFVPVWRLNGGDASITAPQVGNAVPHRNVQGGGTLNNLLCLPKILASHLRSSPSPTMNNSSTPPPGIDDPPRLPPKDSPAVTAPTPTTTPFTWVVPETALVLEALLSLIYPRGTFTSSPEALLTSLELTGRVIRAALGYQSAKALTIARDRMSDFVESSPVDVYAMASFFKFTDLAKLASQRALRVPISSWTNDSRLLMSKTALSRLEELQESRLAGLHGILGRSLEMDEHSAGCVRRGMIEEVWKRKVEQVERTLTPDSELIELLNIDLRGGHCGDCLVQLGKTIQSCLYEAREMPRSI